MTWVLRDQIDPGNVDKIIDAARHGYKRRKVILPDIDRLRLRRDIDRALNRLPHFCRPLPQAAVAWTV